MKTSIQWVNHAAFIIECEYTRLICDPWLFGSAFHNGWDLLCETKFEVDDFADITHIWFSHEHPDHFSPPVLSAIPERYRRKITVIFQQTSDRKVISYCRSLGFMAQELPTHQWYQLEPNCRVMCGKVPFLDSWLFIQTEDAAILNANDCVVDGEGVAKEIVKHTGEVDLLLTQFSYANWEGNPDEPHLRLDSAAEKLRRVKLQVDTFKPQYTIPFASFVYFSHEENFFCNDSINTVEDAHDFIISQTDSTPIVLYPEDRWVIGEEHDNQASLRAYAADYDLSTKPLHKSVSTAVEELGTLADDYIMDIKDKNSQLLMWLMSLPLLNYFQPIQIYLSDLDQTVRFDMRKGLTRVADLKIEPDTNMSSESLAYIFKHDWGFDTLTVNGRFLATQPSYKKLIKTFFLGPLNNTGRYLRPKTFLEPSFVLRALSKLRKTG